MSQNAKIASRGKNDMLSRTRGPDQLDPLALYLDAMGRYPLLTDVDEVELGRPSRVGRRPRQPSPPPRNASPPPPRRRPFKRPSPRGAPPSGSSSSPTS